ncbi:MAG: hypothetical protein K6G42_00530 [Lachnospiraceae bacterium]|nr:hypothetical protein [Lachnospiraceae bacterium]
MNGNDLMNALSGLDPKYIDEAAFELKEDPGKIKKAKVFRMKKILLATIPAAAVILITVTVTLPFLMRNNKSESASYEAADAAAEAEPVYEAAETAEAADAAAEAESVHEAAEAADAAAEAEPVHEAADEAEAEQVYEAKETPAETQSAVADEAAAGTDSLQEAKKREETGTDGALGLENAAYKDGVLTVDINGTIPLDPGKVKYTITGKDGKGSKKTFAEGNLGEILTEQETVRLDLSERHLPKGVYSLSIGDESIEFTVDT